MGKTLNFSTTKLMTKTMEKRRGRKHDKFQGKKTRKAQSRAAQKANEKREEGQGPRPKSFVFRRGDVGESLKALVHDMRRVMMPETAVHLQERRSNTLKEFVDAAVQLDVTHLLCFTEASGTGNTFLRIGRVPRGPTLTFAVEQYSLARAVQGLRARGVRAMGPESPELRTAPLVVLNKFGAGGQALHLAAVTLQNLFPAINLDTVQLRECRRVVLFHYDAATGCVLFRHYLVTAAPSGINRNLRRIVQNQNVPVDAIARARDIADFVLGPAAASESEASDVEDCKVALPQDYVGRGNTAAASPADRSTIRLVEVGPRLQLRLVRVQEQLFDGAVLLGSRDTDSAAAEHRRVTAHRAAVAAKAQQRRDAQDAALAAHIARRKKGGNAAKAKSKDEKDEKKGKKDMRKGKKSESDGNKGTKRARGGAGAKTGPATKRSKRS